MNIEVKTMALGVLKKLVKPPINYKAKTTPKHTVILTEIVLFCTLVRASLHNASAIKKQLTDYTNVKTLYKATNQGLLYYP